jgi:mRNA (guanine-N7-)-methyltransferase
VEQVAQHYNAVPERGRAWRDESSQIRGLRNLNNWIKSTLIQKFSLPEVPTPHLHVLDMACGKGGDLGKWEKAPQVPSMYVGCDIADVSILQARDRFTKSGAQQNRSRFARRPPMQVEFYVHDTFGRSIAELSIVPRIGFNPNTGPGPNVINGAPPYGGFDVVSMMFALHYSFETEELARGMLRNVSGALKKGGRFIGVMPDSDVISSKMKELLALENAGMSNVGGSHSKDNGTSVLRPGGDEEDGEWDPEKPSEPAANINRADDEDEWDPEKPSEPFQNLQNGGDSDDWNPEQPSEPGLIVITSNGQPGPGDAATGTSVTEPTELNLPPLSWGNAIYNISFPREQILTKRPLPRDGIFRPPFGWKYHYTLEEAVNAPEYVVPWEAFRALAEDYGLELMYRKGFRDVFLDESEDRELGMLAERMKVIDRDRSKGRNGLLVNDAEMEAASFYHAFCFYKT